MNSTKFILITILLLTLFSSCNTSSLEKGHSPKEYVKVYDYTIDGFVPDEKTAIKVAEDILPPIYGEDVLNQRPFVAKLVGDTVWHVDGSLPYDSKRNGGVAHIEIRKKDCMILKVIHGK